MELLELKEIGSGDHEHVRMCLRCSTLLANLPALTAADATPADPATLTAGPARPNTSAIEVAPGGIWIADTGEGIGVRELVAIVGRSLRDQRLVVVVPISEQVEDGTNLDISVDPDVLGYPALLAVWNHGWVYDDQLVSRIGRLDDASRQEMTALYRWLVGGGERPDVRVAGPPLIERDDHRQLRRDEERERLQSLWRRVSRDQEPSNETDETRLVASPAATFGSLVSAALSTDEWDEVTLAERAGIGRAELVLITNDELNLTWAKDAPRVVAITKALDLHLDEIEAPLRLSLARSSGGEPIPEEHFRVAARSPGGVSEEDIRQDLSGARINESNEARQRQIETYWQRVVELYESLT